MSDVLVFVLNPDGTITATTALATRDGQTVTPDGLTTVATPPVTLVARPTLSFLRATGSGPYDQLLFATNNSGTTVTGTPKLAQRFLLHLLTPKGSIRYRPTQGCNFLPQLYQGKAGTEADVFAAFAGSLPDLQTNLSAEELNTDPPVELFRSARMTQLAVGNGLVTATIVVSSQAGTPETLNIPLFLDT
jgi:hypothetical protein